MLDVFKYLRKFSTF